MSDPTTAELWSEANRLEVLGRSEPWLVPGSIGQPVLNRHLRDARKLREMARRTEALSSGAATPICERFASQSGLTDWANWIDECMTPEFSSVPGPDCATMVENPLLAHARVLRRYVEQVRTCPAGQCENPECSAEVTNLRRGRPRQFCSDQCRSKCHPTPRTAKVGPRPCAFCGWTFQSTFATHQFCSIECGTASRGVVRRTSRFTVISWDECEDCGETWLNLFSQRTRCQPCSESNRRARVALRRAAHRGADGNRIDPLDVFNRDGWICQLCAAPVLPFVRWPHPRSASIDHIVPVSRGGPHVESNLQLAHLGCNSAKRDRVAA